MVFLTLGTITEEVQRAMDRPVERDAVAYAIRKARVEPIGHAGIVRLFTPDAVDKVCQFLNGKRQRQAKVTTSCD